MNWIMGPLIALAIAIYTWDKAERHRQAALRAEELADLDRAFQGAIRTREYNQEHPGGPQGPTGPYPAWNPACLCGHGATLHNVKGQCLLCECQKFAMPIYSTGYGVASTGARFAPGEVVEWKP